MTSGKVFSVNVSSRKGIAKDMVASARFVARHGVEGDAHAGNGLRQVSLLAMEDIERIEDQGQRAGIDFRPGIFAENITTVGLDLSRLKVGDKLLIGESIILNITQIGKDCHEDCSIKQETGICPMPQQGVFASVENGGLVKVHDRIRLQRQGGLFSWLKK